MEMPPPSESDDGSRRHGNYFAALPARLPSPLLDGLRRGAPGGLRWFHPEDLHVTIAFFGQQDPARLPAICEVLRQITFGGMEITLGEPLALPHQKRFSALAFGLGDGREEIADMIGQWRAPLAEAAGVPAESRPALPHITFARPVRKDPAFRPGATLAWLADLDPTGHTIKLRRPAIYGPSPDRLRRQFHIMFQAR